MGGGHTDAHLALYIRIAPECCSSSFILSTVVAEPVVDDVSVSSSIIVRVEDDITVSREEDSMTVLRNGDKIKHLHSEHLLHSSTIIHHASVGSYCRIGVKSLGIKFGLNSLGNASPNTNGGGFSIEFLLVKYTILIILIPAEGCDLASIFPVLEECFELGRFSSINDSGDWSVRFVLLCLDESLSIPHGLSPLSQTGSLTNPHPDTKAAIVNEV